MFVQRKKDLIHVSANSFMDVKMDLMKDLLPIVTFNRLYADIIGGNLQLSGRYTASSKRNGFSCTGTIGVKRMGLVTVRAYIGICIGIVIEK